MNGDCLRGARISKLAASQSFVLVHPTHAMHRRKQHTPRASLSCSCCPCALPLMLRTPQVTALLLSCVWGLAVFGLSYGAWGGDNAALSSGIAMGVLAFFFGVLTVSFINSSE